MLFLAHRDELTVTILEELPAQQGRQASKEVITGQGAQGLQEPLTRARVGGGKSGKASYEWWPFLPTLFLFLRNLHEEMTSEGHRCHYYKTAKLSQFPHSQLQLCSDATAPMAAAAAWLTFPVTLG